MRKSKHLGEELIFYKLFSFCLKPKYFGAMMLNLDQFIVNYVADDTWVQIWIHDETLINDCYDVYLYSTYYHSGDLTTIDFFNSKAYEKIMNCEVLSVGVKDNMLRIHIVLQNY